MLKEKMVTYFKYMLDGAKRYIGRPLDEVHSKLGITDQQFDVAVGKIINSLKKMRKEGLKFQVMREFTRKINNLREQIVFPPPIEDT